MRRSHLALGSASLALLAVTVPAYAQTATTYDELAKSEAAANAENGKRVSPQKSLRNPSDEVSPEMQAMIGAPYPPHFNADPKTPAEWKELIDRRAKLAIAGLPAMKEKLGVKVEETRIAGVHCFIVTPNKIPADNRRRLLVHVHGGGYVFGPGEAALPEAIMMAGFGGFKVISVDYRMPPDFPYPAAMDDAMAVWKESPTLVTSDIGVPDAMAAGSGRPSCLARNTIASVMAPPVEVPKIAMRRWSCRFTVSFHTAIASSIAAG